MSDLMSTKRNVYTLKFRSSHELYFFSTDEQLNEILRLPNTKHGIEKIKVYNNKDRFIRVSKTDFQNWFSFNTEAMEILRNINFLK
jgi:hypothetical protein